MSEGAGVALWGGAISAADAESIIEVNINPLTTAAGDVGRTEARIGSNVVIDTVGGGDFWRMVAQGRPHSAPAQGWSPERSKLLAPACLATLDQML